MNIFEQLGYAKSTLRELQAASAGNSHQFALQVAGIVPNVSGCGGSA